jgi:hypothetical protein
VTDPEEGGETADGGELTQAGNTHPEAQDRAPAFLFPVDAFADALRRGALARQPRKTRVFARPFALDDADMRQLDKRVREQLASAGSGEVFLQVDVRYADLSSESFQDLGECLERAGEEADAESVIIRWESVIDDRYVFAVTIDLITEQPLVTYAELGPMPEAARITIQASAPSRTWVSATLDALAPLADSFRLSRLYAPLEVLKSDLYRTIGGFVLGAVAWFVSLRLLTSLISDPSNADKANTILSKHGGEAQFRAFIHEFYGPQQGFVSALLVFLIPYGLLFAVQMMGQRYLAHLVPRSFIGLGLSRKRYKDYENVFRFVVFGVLVALVVGVAGSGLYDLLS